MFTKTSFSLLSSFILLTPSVIKASIFSQTDVKLTFYYDIGDKGGCGQTQGDPVPAGWADSSGINAGATYCEQQRGMSLNQIGTNRIVAFDQDKVWANPAEWCGREVKVYGPDGGELLMPDGPFYIWDSCQNCAGGGKVLDVSGETFVKAKGGTCGGNNPTGYRYDVLESYVVDPSVGLNPGGPPVGGSSPSTSIPPVFPTSPAVVPPTSVVPPPTPSSAGIYIPSSASLPQQPSNPPTVVPPVAPPATSAPPVVPPVQAPPPTVSQAQPPPVQATTPTAAPTKAHGWGGWGGHGGHGGYGGYGGKPAASPRPIAAIAEIDDSTNTTSSSNMNVCRRRRKRRLAKLH